MAGLPSTTVSFTAPPSLDAIASHVERKGGLPIGSRIENSSLRLHFACFPKTKLWWPGNPMVAVTYSLPTIAFREAHSISLFV